LPVKHDTPPILANAVYARMMGDVYIECVCLATEKRGDRVRGIFYAPATGPFPQDEGSQEFSQWALVRKPSCRKDGFIAGSAYKGPTPSGK